MAPQQGRQQLLNTCLDAYSPLALLDRRRLCRDTCGHRFSLGVQLCLTPASVHGEGRASGRWTGKEARVTGCVRCAPTRASRQYVSTGTLLPSTPGPPPITPKALKCSPEGSVTTVQPQEAYVHLCAVGSHHRLPAPAPSQGEDGVWGVVWA